MKGFVIKVSVEPRRLINPLQPGKDIVLEFHCDAHTMLTNAKLLRGHWGLIRSHQRNINRLCIKLHTHIRPLPICFFPELGVEVPAGRCQRRATQGDKQPCTLATVV